MKVRTSSGVIEADTTATDITFTGAGVCNAAIFIPCGATVEDASQLDVMGGIGFTDFTVQTCINFSGDNAVTPADTNNFHRHHATLGAVWIEDTGNTIKRSASLSAITNGIRITPQESGAAQSFIVICFFGGTWDCFTLDVTKTTAQTEVRAHGLGTKPNVGFFSHANTYNGGGNSGHRCWGFMSDEGTLEQAAVMGMSLNNAGGTSIGSQIHTSRCAGQTQSNGVMQESCEITSNDATNTTFSMRDVNWTNKPLIGLLGLIDETTNLAMVNSPNSAAVDWNVNDNSFISQAVIGVLTRMLVIDTTYNDDNASAQAYFCMTEEGEECSVSWRDNDDADPTELDNECRSADIILKAASGATDDYDFDNPTFTSDGFDIAAVDIQIASATTHIFPMLFIGQEDTGGVVINRVLTETTAITDPVPGTLLRQRIPGDRIELLSDGVFLYTALGRLLFDNFEVDDAFTLRKIVDDQLSQVSDLTDALDIMRQVFRQVSEAISVGDNVNTSVALARLNTDSLSTSDSLAQLLERQRTVDDSVTLKDFFAKIVTVGESQQTFAVLLEEILNIADTPQLAFHGTNNRDFADTISVAEFIALNHIRQRVMLSEAGVIDSALANASRHQQTLDTLSNTDALVPVRRRTRQPAVDSLSTSDLSDSFSVRGRRLFLNLNDELDILDGNSFAMSDDILVTRSAIINIALNTDTLTLVDFLRASSGTLLPPADICIEHGIQNQ